MHVIDNPCIWAANGGSLITSAYTHPVTKSQFYVKEEKQTGIVTASV